MLGGGGFEVRLSASLKLKIIEYVLEQSASDHYFENVEIEPT